MFAQSEVKHSLKASLFASLILILLISATANAQTYYRFGKSIDEGVALPATPCATSELFYLTSAPLGIYVCTSAHEWIIYDNVASPTNPVASTTEYGHTLLATDGGSTPGTVVQGNDSRLGGSSGLPVGSIILTLTSCPSGFAEASELNGVTLIGTVTANGDVGTTGGADSITPTGSNSAPTFTGNSFSSVINHTHVVNINDPGHTHSMPTFTTDGAGSRPDNGSSTNGTTVTVPSNTTGITATTNNPAGGVASITPTGSVTAPTFTGNQFDNRSAFKKVIFCKKT